MKGLQRILSILLVITLVFLCGCANEHPKDTNEVIENNFGEKKFPVTVSEDIEIVEAFLYSGEFPEDGSFKNKNDVFALKVVNNSSKDLQLVRIYVITDQKECLFEITTLPSKKAVTIFEKNAQSLSKDEKVLEIREENKVFFERELSLHSEKIQITPLDKVLNIKNVSTQDITSDVYVYFKRMDANGDYFGGITFRSNVGSLKAGEFKQIPAPHFNKDDSKVLFVDYAMQ